MKTIVHVIDSLNRGGAETLLINTIKSLVEYRHIVVTIFKVNDFEQELKHVNHVEVLCLNSKGVKDFPIKVFQLRSLIRRLSPDIVHSQLYWGSVLARIATPKTKKFFFTNQCLQRDEAFKKRWTVLVEKFTYSPRHTLISVSKAVEDEYNEFIGLKGDHYILRNFADDSFFKGVKSFNTIGNKFRFVTSGRLHPQKNQKLLIEGFSKLPFQFSLSIYGKGELDAELKNLSRTLGAKNISFEGSKSNMYDIIRNYDVFVMASFYEGFSLAVVEAMASGLPVLLPDLVVFREMAGEAGTYFDINDANDLAAKIVAMCSLENLQILSAKSVAQADMIGKKSNFLDQLRALYNSQ